MWILIKISLKFVSPGPTYNKSMLVLVMAWCHQGTSNHFNLCWTSYLNSPQVKMMFKIHLPTTIASSAMYNLTRVSPKCWKCLHAANNSPRGTKSITKTKQKKNHITNITQTFHVIQYWGIFPLKQWAVMLNMKFAETLKTKWFLLK